SGFFTVKFAQCGLDVTAVDINRDNLAVLEALAAARKLKVRTFNGTFLQAPDEKRYDIVLFYESFHHCLDFEAALIRLRERLAPGGIIIFANEAIYLDFPKPWGLRLDGPSLFEIRTHGWLELGFSEGFFFEMLERHGYTAEKRSHADVIDIFTARPN